MAKIFNQLHVSRRKSCEKDSFDIDNGFAYDEFEFSTHNPPGITGYV